MWQLLAGAGLQAVGNILGSRSARKAGQAAANIRAGQAGENAQLARDLPYRLNPYLQQSAEQWSGNVRDQAGQSGRDLIETAGRGATGVRNAAGRGAQAATETAYQANALLDPYMGYGSEAGRMLLEQPGYTPTEWNAPKPFTAADLEMDPGYQFRLAEGNKALERSAAAKGILQSGGTLKALTRYGQDAASQEYANAWDRAMQGRKQDFAEWSGVNDVGLRSAGLRLNSLGQLVGIGANAAGKAGDNFTRATEYGNTLMTDAEKFGAGLETGASQTAGGWNNDAARWQSGLMYGSTRDQLGNIFAGENAGMHYMTDRADALAGGNIAAGQAQAGMWQNLGNTAGQGMTMWGLSQAGRQGAGGGSPTNNLATQGYMQNYYPYVPWGA